MVSALRVLVAFAVASTAATFAAQLALHVAARRAARGRHACRDHDEPPGALGVVRAATRETALSLLVLLLWPLGARVASADGRRTAVLVHGFASSPASLWLLARRLRRDGWAVSVPRLGAWWRDLDDAADRLAMHLERLRERSGAPGVVVVAHGLAGLATRLLLRRQGRHARIRMVLTLGTPHGGTRAAPCLARGLLRRDVRPGSAALRALDAAALPPLVAALAIASPDDALVVPFEHALWADACNVSVDGSGHLDLLVSARVYAVIAENLAAVPEAALRRHGP